MPIENSWVVAVTGASGARYALRLIEICAQKSIKLHCIFSDSAIRVLNEEEGIIVSGSNLSTEKLFKKEYENVLFYNFRDIGASIASGSFNVKGMVIIPCSMSTLGAVANGISTNLIHRAADVTLKEGRKLILVPRETPLNAIHLENMLKLSRLGITILPAMPGFYHKPKTLEDLIDMQVMKVLDNMGIENDLVRRWN